MKVSCRMQEKLLLILKIQQHIFFLLENSIHSAGIVPTNSEADLNEPTLFLNFLHNAGIVPTSSETVITHLIIARNFPTRCGKNSYKFRNNLKMQ